MIINNQELNIIKKDINTTMIDNNGSAPFIVYNKLKEIDFIGHGFSTRLGGVSKEHLYSMNLSFNRGDARENVLENFKRISESIGFDYKDIVMSMQTHTTNVLRVSKKDCGNGITKKLPYSDVDGLITNENQVVLSTFYADCVPLFFVDVKNKAIGLSHSGWRGTVERMGEKTIKMMEAEFGSNPNDIIVAIGPSICMDCYEVSEDVAVRFAHEFNNQDKILYKKNDEKYQLNLWEANKEVCQDAGIMEENIIMPDICTCCNPDLLYSHRASKGQRGNLAAFLFIK